MSTDPKTDTECPSVIIDIMEQTHEEVIARCDRMHGQLDRMNEQILQLKQEVKQLKKERDDANKSIEKRRKQQEKINTEFAGCTAM
jgi:uncharacterized coiled-coil DUF342 family protein